MVIIKYLIINKLIKSIYYIDLVFRCSQNVARKILKRVEEMGRYREPYTIYKRGDYWYYRTYNNNGVRTPGKTTGKKQKNEARAFCEELYKSGKLFISSKEFGAFAAGFFDPNSFYIKDRVKPLSRSTLELYNCVLNRYILPYFSNYKLENINYIELKKFRMSLLDRGLALNTINAIMNVLGIILKAAYRAGDISSYPLDKLEKLQSLKNNKKDAFTLEEVKLVYKNISPEFKSIILIMALAGMRISEVFGVTEEDFKTFSYGEYINLNKQYNRGYLPLKTKSSFRPIPITKEIKALFKDITPTDSKKTDFNIEFRKIKANIKNATERNLSPHSLRHFFITNCKSKGLIESKVEFVAGHSLKGISKVYTNYKPDDLKEFLEWQEVTYKLITEC